MASASVSHRIEIEQDLRHEHWEWRIERLAWAIFVLILLAGLAGLFGEGPLSHALVQSDGAPPFSVEYERFARRQLPMEITVRLSNGTLDAATHLSISRAYLTGVEVRSIVPEPASWSAGGEWVGLDFAANGEAGPLAVTLTVVPQRAGRLNATLRLGDGPEATITQWVYP